MHFGSAQLGDPSCGLNQRISSRVEVLLTQNRMRASKGEHAVSEPVNFLMLFEIGPVNPARFIVLAVSVVVAALGAAEFISSQQHWHPARDQQGQKEVLDPAFPESLDSGIRCLAFTAAVLAEFALLPSWLSSPFASLCLSR